MRRSRAPDAPLLSSLSAAPPSSTLDSFFREQGARRTAFKCFPPPHALNPSSYSACAVVTASRQRAHSSPSRLPSCPRRSSVRSNPSKPSAPQFRLLFVSHALNHKHKRCHAQVHHEEDQPAGEGLRRPCEALRPLQRAGSGAAQRLHCVSPHARAELQRAGGRRGAAAYARARLPQPSQRIRMKARDAPAGRCTAMRLWQRSKLKPRTRPPSYRCFHSSMSPSLV
jgi:hypothetical protein